jgi:uncharacterized membrane protein YhaH (DUF805 family)
MNDTTTTASYSLGLAGGALVAVIIVSLAIMIVTVWAYVNIIRRAGYSGWWVLISLVPLVGTIMFFVFAFAEWPVMRELRALRAQVGGGQFGPGQFGPGPGQYGPGPQPGYGPGGPGYPPPGGPYHP